MPQLSTKIEDSVTFLTKHWLDATGLITAFIIASAIEVPLLVAAKASLKVDAIVLLATVIVIVSAWLISRLPPKTPKDKIGFLVSIFCSDDKESEKIREDFIIPLRSLVKTGRAGKFFHFMELPQHLAKQLIEPDAAQALRIRCKAHFMLFGRVRLREIEGKQHHYVELEGVVAHSPIPKSVNHALAQEFAELLPRKVGISTENDLFSFHFTSEWADIVARYIIGIAATYSGDVDYAETLYTDVRERLQHKPSTFPVYAKLTERIPIRISELYELRAAVTHRIWTSSHSTEHFEQLGSYLQKIHEAHLNRPDVLNLRAIYVFLKHKNVDEAITILRQSGDQNNGVWHYNLAFLLGYKKDLKGAIRHYRLAIIFEVEANVIYQVEDFISWVIEQEPDKYQLYYCLGFFNWNAKGDATSAIESFTTFLRLGNEAEYPKERELANKWIGEISSQTTG